MNRTFLIVRYFGICLAFFAANYVQAQEKLQADIEKWVQTINGEIGVGIKNIEEGSVITVHGRDHFPMQSVYKFHLALAILKQVDQGKLSVDQRILIRKEDLLPKTHSPIRDKYPDGNIELSLKEILAYTVSQSDNIGCDILFKLVGGPKKVEAFIHDLGIKDVAIGNTEKEMHKAWDLQFKNWTTPESMVQLLDLFYKRKILKKSTHDLLVDIMVKTTTGKNRIKGLLPEGTVVAHKTGMGGDNEVITAINDVGVITLPNGRHIAISIFISNTKESAEKLESVMAKISKAAFDYYSK
jgi:beta-lactamase class A